MWITLPDIAYPWRSFSCLLLHIHDVFWLRHLILLNFLAFSFSIKRLHQPTPWVSWRIAGFGDGYSEVFQVYPYIPGTHRLETGNKIKWVLKPDVAERDGWSTPLISLRRFETKRFSWGGGVSFFLPSIAFAVRLLMSTWESRNPNCRGMISDPHTDCRRVLKDHRWVSQQILQASEKRDVQIPEGVRCVPLFLSALTWVRGHSMFLFELGCVECPKRRSLAMPPIPRSNKQIPCPDRRYPSLILRPSSNSPSFHVQDKPIFIAQTYFFLVCRFIFLKQKRGCTSLCCWCEILHDMISSSFYWTHGSFFLVRLIGFFLLGGRCSLY